MFTLELARAHIRDLHRAAARQSAAIEATRGAGRLRRRVQRRHSER